MNKHIPLLLTTAAVMSLCAAPVLAHEEDSGGTNYSVGEPANAADAHRTVKVGMADTMKYTFEPDLAVIGVGEIITFEVTNNGKINHEFSIGNQEDQKEHAIMMMKMPNMVHKDPTTITVPPGETKSITWLFKGGDLVVFACNIPGHYQAGMFKKSPMITEEEHDEEHAEEEHSH